MAYDFTPNAGRVRMLIGDTDESNPVVSDDEVTAALALNSDNVYGAAADLCRGIAANAAKSAIAYSILSADFKVDKKRVPDYYLALANKYDAKAELAADIDSTDSPFVDWGLLVSNVDGRDDTDYDDNTYDDDNAGYYEEYYSDGDV